MFVLECKKPALAVISQGGFSIWNLLVLRFFIYSFFIDWRMTLAHNDIYRRPSLRV
jgi:hypothetical protein